MNQKSSVIMRILALALMGVCLSLQSAVAQSKVYFTSEISPEALVKIYEALGVKPEGRVCVKISTGEGGNNHYLKPTLIRNLVERVNGTIVECCTAYGGTRQDPKKHWETIHEHGFDSIFAVDLMDEYESIRIPVKDQKWIKYDIVGEHLAHYDWMINLAHFKGHQMGGFGGVLKNASIGVASASGKAYIHTAGYTEKVDELWGHVDDQDGFVESMAAAAQAVHNFFGKGERIVYIAVMNNMSIDCDCNANPQKPLIEDYGIVASTDPVALDQACYDIISKIHNDKHNNNKPLLERIAKQHGTHILEWGEKIGLGSRRYTIINIDK